MVKGGVTYKIVADAIGSVRLVVAADSGEVVQRLDYDEFGRVLRDTSPGFQPFGFAGGLYDADTGLVRFGARDYDPVVGRWTAKDPIGFGGGDTNLYAYAGSDPINFIDPTGTDARGFAIGVGTAIGADIGFVLGGGTGVAATLSTGGLALGATPGLAGLGAAGGALAGAALGAATYDLAKALSNLLLAGKADIKFVDWLSKKYNLDRDARRDLHDEITRQGLSREEIEEIAREIARQRGVCDR
jgi:RHS repeat-associated protein